MCYGSAFSGWPCCFRGCFGGYELPCICKYLTDRWEFNDSNPMVLGKIPYQVFIIFVLYFILFYGIFGYCWKYCGNLIENYFSIFCILLFIILSYCSLVISKSILLFCRILKRLVMLNIGKKEHVASVMNPFPGCEQHGFDGNNCISISLKDMKVDKENDEK